MMLVAFVSDFFYIGGVRFESGAQPPSLLSWEGGWNKISNNPGVVIRGGYKIN
jgi:hypothetical protein